MSVCFQNVILILAALFYASGPSVAQNKDEGAINISLINYKPQNVPTQVFDALIELNSGTNTLVNVNDVPLKGIEFFIIQVHSYKSSVILSYDEKLVPTSYVNGTNVGLVQLVSNEKYQFYLKNDQKNTNNTVYIAVIPYERAPVPGGCNMEFMTEIAPYQILQFNDALVTVDAQMASLNGVSCENQIVIHTIYQMYLPETDFSAETYFDGIRNMLTVENITLYGTQVSRPRIGFLRHFYSAYRGTGSVYVIVAAVNGSRSAYVPIVSYACDISNPNTSCESLTTTVSRLLAGLLVFVGLFTCFYGHKFFKTEMFLVGSLVGYIFFLILSDLVDFNEDDMILLSTGVGIVIGLIWVGFWWYFAIPVFSTLLPLIILGYLIASIIFYSGINDLTIVNNNITYWGFFSSIILLCLTVFTGFMDKANILACAVVGSYAFIIPLDHYFGSNLRYIFINVYRRITAENYNMASINPPYQSKDLLLTVVWVVLAISGTICQLRDQKGKPPFPPTSSRLHLPTERTPLLMPTSSRGPSDRIILIHSAPSDA